MHLLSNFLNHTSSAHENCHSHSSKTFYQDSLVELAHIERLLCCPSIITRGAVVAVCHAKQLDVHPTLCGVAGHLCVAINRCRQTMSSINVAISTLSPPPPPSSPPRHTYILPPPPPLPAHPAQKTSTKNQTQIRSLADA